MIRLLIVLSLAALISGCAHGPIKRAPDNATTPVEEATSTHVAPTTTATVRTTN